MKKKQSRGIIYNLSLVLNYDDEITATTSKKKPT